jgi:hypothetical protein
MNTYCFLNLLSLCLRHLRPQSYHYLDDWGRPHVMLLVHFYPPGTDCECQAALEYAVFEIVHRNLSLHFI